MRITLPCGTRKSVYLGVYGSPESKAEYARRVQSVGANASLVIEVHGEGNLSAYYREDGNRSKQH